MPPKSKYLMKYKENRIRTFNETVKVTRAKKSVKWEDNNDQNLSEALSECGFYYTPVKTNLNQITCCHCYEVETIIKPVDVKKLLTDHHNRNGICSLALILLAQIENDELATPGESHDFWKNHEVDAISNPLGEEGKELRLSFYHDFPLDTIPGFKSVSAYLSECGFIYSPIFKNDDRVSCFYCNCSLEGWEKDDDPIEEHQKSHVQFCYFLECYNLDKKSADGVVASSPKLTKEIDQSRTTLEDDVKVKEIVESPSKPSVVYVSDHMIDEIASQSPSSSDSVYEGPEFASDVSQEPVRRSTRLRNKPVRKDPNDAYWNKVPDRSLYDEFMGKTSQETGPNPDKSSDFDFYSSIKNESGESDSDYESVVSNSSVQSDRDTISKTKVLISKESKSQSPKKKSEPVRNRKRNPTEMASNSKELHEINNVANSASKKKLKVFNKAFSPSPLLDENVNQSFDGFDDDNIDALEKHIVKVNAHPNNESATPEIISPPPKKSISPIKIDFSSSNVNNRVKRSTLFRKSRKPDANILDTSYDDDLLHTFKGTTSRNPNSKSSTKNMETTDKYQNQNHDINGVSINKSSETNNQTKRIYDHPNLKSFEASIPNEDYIYKQGGNLEGYESSHINIESSPEVEEENVEENDKESLEKAAPEVNSVFQDTKNQETKASDESVTKDGDLNSRDTFRKEEKISVVSPYESDTVHMESDVPQEDVGMKDMDSQASDVGPSVHSVMDVDNALAENKDNEVQNHESSSSNKIRHVGEFNQESIYYNYVNDIKQINVELSKSLELLSENEKEPATAKISSSKGQDIDEANRNSISLDDELLLLADPSSAEGNQSPKIAEVKDTDKSTDTMSTIDNIKVTEEISLKSNNQLSNGKHTSTPMEVINSNDESINNDLNSSPGHPSKNPILDSDHFIENKVDVEISSSSIPERDSPVKESHISSIKNENDSSRVSNSDPLEVSNLDYSNMRLPYDHISEVQGSLKSSKLAAASPRKSTPELVIDHNSEPADEEEIFNDDKESIFAEHNTEPHGADPRDIESHYSEESQTNATESETKEETQSLEENDSPKPAVSATMPPNDSFRNSITEHNYPHSEMTDMSGNISGNFSGVIESSTPQKIALTSVSHSPLKPQWLPKNLASVLDTIHNLEDTASYLRGVSQREHDLNNDYDNELTTFISAMPEEEENMTIQEWIRYSASNYNKLVRESCQEMIDIYQSNYDMALRLLDGLPTED